MSTQAKPFLTPEQYLEIERAAEHKSEYYAGEMFAMAGAREGHNLIVANAMRDLGNQIRDRACRLYSNDMRVNVRSTGLYTYPDVVLVSDRPQFLDNQTDTLLNPLVLIEVLSPSTEAYDRGRKFDQYKRIESLREYVLIAADRVQVDLYTRQPDNRWLLTSASGLDETLAIESASVSLSLAALYEKVDLEAIVVGPSASAGPR